MRSYRIRPRRWASIVGLVAVILVGVFGIRDTHFLNGVDYVWLLVVVVVGGYYAANLILPDGLWMPYPGFRWQMRMLQWQGYDMDPPLDEEE